MPILLIGSGLVLVIVGLNGNPAKLYSLVANDFVGPHSFVYWFLSMLILGAIGYIPSLEKLSKAFLILVLIVLFLDNGGFFKQFQAAVVETTGRTPQPNAQGFTAVLN